MFLQKSIQLVLFSSLLVQFCESSSVATFVNDESISKQEIAPIHLSLVERSKATAVATFNKRSATSSVPLINDIDTSQFGINVQIGTPPQDFILMFDTGSTDTWVSSTDCTAKDGCPDSLKRFHPTNSSTYQIVENNDSQEENENDSVNIMYGIGQVEGHYFKDVFALPVKNIERNESKQDARSANATTIAPLYKNDCQQVVLASKADGPLSHQNPKSDKDKADIVLDGIFAAGLTTATELTNSKRTGELETQSSNISSKAANSELFIPSLYHSNIITKPVFSVALAEKSVILGDVHSSNGSYVYTDVASAKNRKLHKENNAPSTLRWDANVYRFQFQNASRAFNFHFDKPAAFGFDTGSNFLYLPEALAHDLAAVVSHNTYKKPTDRNPYFLIDCAFRSSQQFVSIYFNSSPSSYNKKMLNDEVSMKIPVKHLIAQRESDKQCLLLFVPSNDKFIIGNMILRHFYTVFDFGEEPKIGFAPYYTTSNASDN